jgi:hypothetical protein
MIFVVRRDHYFFNICYHDRRRQYNFNDSELFGTVMLDGVISLTAIANFALGFCRAPFRVPRPV